MLRDLWSGNDPEVDSRGKLEVPLYSSSIGLCLVLSTFSTTDTVFLFSYFCCCLFIIYGSLKGYSSKFMYNKDSEN